MLRTLYVFIFMAIFTNNAKAICSGIIDGFSLPRNEKLYDPFNASATFDEYSIRIINHGGETCSFAIVFSSYSDIRQLGGVIPYSIYDVNQKPVIVSSTPSNSGITASHVNTTADIPFWINIERGILAAPGNYKDDIIITLYSVDGGNFKECDRKILNINYRVNEALKINIGGNNENWDVDFGELKLGMQRSVSLLARSNIPYHFKIYSTYHSELNLEPPILNQKWFIPYKLAIDGNAIDLRNMDLKPIAASVTPINGRYHSIVITIGDVHMKRSGVYKDVINVEIVPNYIY